MNKESKRMDFNSGPAYFVWIVAALLSFYLIREGINSGNTNAMIVMVILTSSILLLTAWITFGTKYSIVDESVLIIKCPPITWPNIRISEITEIRRTWNPISSPAPSLNRIKVKFGNGRRVIISPTPKSKFAYELKRINPNIKIEL